MSKIITEANQRLKELNKDDIKTFKKLINTILVCFIFLVLCSILSLFYLKTLPAFFGTIFYLLFIGIFYIIILYWNIIWENRNQFIKKEVYAKYLKENFPQIIYEPDSEITKKGFSECGLFNLSNLSSFGSNDKFQIQGSNQINGIEVTAIEGHGKYAQYVFKGLFISAIHNNNFEGETYIIPSGFSTTFSVAKYTNFIKNPKITKNQKVILESPVFMKQYDVYTTSQLGARLALTTDIIDSINQLTEQTKLPILFSFIESTVYICVASQDLFKISNYSTEVESNLKTLGDEMNWLIEFTEKLKLHQTKF